MIQDSLVDFVGQDAAPELPSQVEDLPIAYGYWFLFLAAAALLLWWSWAWMRQAQHNRKTHLDEQRVVEAEASASSAQRAMVLLRNYLQELSVDQRREAECLSHLLREQIGRNLQRDCHSATDTEILREAHGRRKSKAPVASAVGDLAPADLAPGILTPLLAFVSGVLFADQRPAVVIWQATLKDVEAWLLTQGEQV